MGFRDGSGALAELGSRFLSKPIVYTTYSRAIAIAPKERNLLSFVLVKPLPGVAATDLARSITRETGLRARTSQEFADDTYWFYVRTTGVVARIGFMVGIKQGWQAPFVAGVGIATLVVLFNIGPYANAAPRVVVIAIVSAILLGVGITWEDRVRDGRKLVGYVRSMR